MQMCEVMSKLSPPWLVNWKGIPKSLLRKSERDSSVGLKPASSDKGKLSLRRTRLGPALAIAALAPDSASQPAETSTLDCRFKDEPRSHFHGKFQFTKPSA